MKPFFNILIFSIAFINLYSQKHDYQWILGHNGGTRIDFNESPPLVSFRDNEVQMGFVNASVSDENGVLQFFTNGCHIYNRDGVVMENGANINPGPVHNNQCSGAFSAYTAIRGAMALPAPGSDSLYYLFHQGKVTQNEPVFSAYVTKQYYSLIDMRENGGLGKVLAKNQIVIEDTLQGGDLIAIKHSNNLYWWIIIPKRFSNKYFKALLQENDIISITEQIIGDPTSSGSDGGGQAVFSPDGTLYVRYNPVNDIFLFDFDRSTGELSNYRHIPVSDGNAFVGGAAISPNSRYLYISAETKFFQFDLQAPDIAASEVLLGEYDGFQSPFATTFFSCQLAPDCKIYCTCSNSADRFHVVHYPDEPGLASGFEQHGLQLATSNAFSIPNFPNYRLGSGEPTCVPTAVEEEAAAVPALSLSPNPASGWVRLATEDEFPKGADFHLYDLTGRLLRSWPLSAGQREQVFPLAGLADGLYVWRVEVQGRQLQAGKMIVSSR